MERAGEVEGDEERDAADCFECVRAGSLQARVHLSFTPRTGGPVVGRLDWRVAHPPELRPRAGTPPACGHPPLSNCLAPSLPPLLSLVLVQQLLDDVQVGHARPDGLGLIDGLHLEDREREERVGSPKRGKKSAQARSAV